MSYIELSKNATLPTASSAGKASIGMNNSGNVVVSTNSGTASVLSGKVEYDYNSYVAKLTYSDTLQLSPGNEFTTGSIYKITNYNSGDDFSNMAYVLKGTINTTNCVFIATNTTPDNWTHGSSIYQSLPPTPSVVKNTLGFTPEWKLLSDSDYYFNFTESVNFNKIFPRLGPNVHSGNLFPYTAVNPQNYQYVNYSFYVPDGANNFVHSTAIQSDGKVLVGGSFTAIGTATSYGIARLDANGTYDYSFDIGTGVTATGGGVGTVRALAVSSSEDIFLAGGFRFYNGYTVENLIKVDSTGFRSSDFATSNFTPGSTVYALALQSDGKLICGGNFLDYRGTARECIVRINVNGSLDTSFNIGSGFNDDVLSLAIQPDGKILVGGLGTSYSGSNVPNNLVRLNTDGTWDTSFNNGGSGFNDQVTSITIQPDGKILVGGKFTEYNGTDVPDSLIRLNTDGTVDTSFNNGGVGFDNSVNALSLEPGGDMIVGGDFGNYNNTGSNFIIKLNSSGSIIHTFDQENSNFDNSLYTISPLPNKQIIVGGRFTTYNNQSTEHILGLNTAYDVVISSPSNICLNKTPVEITQFK